MSSSPSRKRPSGACGASGCVDASSRSDFAAPFEIVIVNLEVAEQEERGGRRIAHRCVPRRNVPERHARTSTIARNEQHARVLVRGNRRELWIAGNGRVHARCVAGLVHARERAGVRHAVGGRQCAGLCLGERADRTRRYAGRNGTRERELVESRITSLVEYIEHLALLGGGRRALEKREDPRRQRLASGVIARGLKLNLERRRLVARSAICAGCAREVTAPFTGQRFRGQSARARHRELDPGHKGAPRSAVVGHSRSAEPKPIRHTG